MASTKAGKDEKVFDVSKPGKTAASASSRPLIIGHKTTLKDPMVKDSNNVSADASSEFAVLEGEAALEAPPEKEKPSREGAPEMEISGKTDESANEASKSAPIAVEAKKKQAEANRVNVARNEALEKVTSGGEHFVPINDKTRKKLSLRHILIGSLLIILLGGMLIYLMIDAGIIKVNFELPIHFFKQDATATTLLVDTRQTT